MTLDKFFMAGLFPQRFFRLLKIWPFEVSAVDHGANKRDFLIRKDDSTMPTFDAQTLVPKLADALYAHTALVRDLTEGRLTTAEQVEPRMADLLAKLGLVEVAKDDATPPEPAAVLAPASSPEPATAEPASTSADPAANVMTAAPQAVQASNEAETVVKAEHPDMAPAADPAAPRMSVADACATLVQAGFHVVLEKAADVSKASEPAPVAAPVEQPVPAPQASPDPALHETVLAQQTALRKMESDLANVQAELAKANTLLRKRGEEPNLPASIPATAAPTRPRMVGVGDNFNDRRNA